MQVQFAKKNDGRWLVLLDRIILQKVKENAAWAVLIAMAKNALSEKKELDQ